MQPHLPLYLTAGLILHKGLWEALKRGRASSRLGDKRKLTLSERAIKLAKLTILFGIVVQIWTPCVLPVLDDPRPLWIVGVALYTLGLGIAITARLQLGRCWMDIESAKVLADQYVVSRGVYRYVRHPIYTGDLLLLLGLELSLNSWLFVFVLILAPLVVERALREERMLMESLPGYDAYCKVTKRFVPFLV